MTENIAETGVLYELSNCDIMRLDVDTEHWYYGGEPGSKDPKQYYMSLTRVLDIGSPFPEGLRQYLRITSFDEQIERLEFTGARGSKLHEALDMLMQRQGLDLKANYQSSYEKDAIVTFRRMMRFLDPGKYSTELIVADPDLRIAGTLDFKGIVDEWKLACLLDSNKYLDIDSEGDLQLKEKWLDLPSTYQPSPVVSSSTSISPSTSVSKSLSPSKLREMHKTKRICIIIDWKFTGRNAYSHKIQVAAYKTMNNKSRKGVPASRAFTWRYSPKHKFGFDFSESLLNYHSFKRIYDTTIEYLGEFPEPPLIKRYPEQIRLYEETK